MKKVSLMNSKFSVGKIGIYIILVFWALTTIYPLLWVLNNSFKDRGLILQDSFSLVTQPSLANYVTAFTTINIGQAYINSFIISGSVVVAVMFFGGLASYVIARYSFKGKIIIHGVFIMGGVTFSGLRNNCICFYGAS